MKVGELRALIAHVCDDTPIKIVQDAPQSNDWVKSTLRVPELVTIDSFEYKFTPSGRRLFLFVSPTIESEDI